MSSQRIIKYYMNRLKGQTPTPNPGDDTSIPNLIISQRRQIPLGHVLDIELLNVPDTANGEPYTVQLTLLDENDRAVYESAPVAFNTAELKDKTFDLASEDFKQCRALRPRLTIDYRNSKRVFEAGLPFTVLRTTTAWDQTYFCTPLRNVLQPKDATIEFTTTDPQIAPGVAKVALSAALDSPEQLAVVEVVQDSRVVFVHDPHNEYLQNDPDRRLFNLSWFYINQKPRSIRMDFNVTLQGAPSALTFTRPPDQEDPTVKAMAIEAFSGDPFVWALASHWQQTNLISIAGQDLAQATLTIKGVRRNGPHKGEPFTWHIALNELGEYGVISKVFDDGLMFALQTQYRPRYNTLPMQSQAINFEHPIIADQPHGILALRAITTQGKVYWSKPFTASHAPSHETVPTYVYSDKAGKGIKLMLAKDRVPHIRYDFTPRWGNILHTGAGRGFYGHAGGYIATAIGFQGLESAHYSLPYCDYEHHIFEGADKPAPQWVEYEPGQWALDFDGERGNFLAMPNTLIPQRAGFTLAFEIMPDRVKPWQVLFANEGHNFGTINLGVRDGKFEFYFFRRTPWDPMLPAYSKETFKTGIPLHPGQWQRVVLTYDESELTLSANGMTESFPFRGIGLFLQPNGFGGRGERTDQGAIPFFDGLLRALEVKHYVEQTPEK